MSKLRFRVVHATSEDPSYPAEELNVHSPNTRGWQSVKFCEFPQELGFEIDGGDVKVSQVQILSHQSKIATKIEIFIGAGSSYSSATFKRLGYLSLDSNERSQYQARELKTVYIDNQGRYIRLLVHRNYVNKQNLFNQVGIVAVNLLGADNGGGGERSSGGALHAAGGGAYNNPLNDLSIDMNLDPQTAAKLRLLSDAKVRLLTHLSRLSESPSFLLPAASLNTPSSLQARAVATEDYLVAKQIKVVEGDLKSLGARLAQLDMAKRQAVGAEDYDRAKEIKDETDELRGEIERRILAIHIPGVTDGFQRSERPIGKDTRNIPRFAPSKADEEDPYADPFEEEGTSGLGIDSRLTYKSGPLNIDDMPAGVAQRNDGSFAQEKASGRPAYDPYGIASAPDEQLPGGDRPIRPKQRSYADDKDPALGEDYGDEEPSRFREDTFPAGKHPLEGVANLSELPAPEDLVGKARDVSEQSGVTHLIGDYRARCLFSKTWALREAAITKVHMMVAELEHEPGITACIPALSTIIRVGVEDKIQQVLFNAIALLEDVLAATRRAKIPRSVLAPLMDPITADLLEKLSDGNARIREGARKGVEVLAASPNIGPAVLAAHALRQLSAKQKTAWRPIVARLELMTSLVSTYGVGGTTGISADGFMNFAKANACFAHSNGEVRDAARDLTVALHKLVGTTALEPYLRTLRPKQLEEYEAAFGGIKTGIVLNDDIKAPSKKASVKDAGGGSQAKAGGGVMSPREDKPAAAPKAASAKPSAASARQSPAKSKGKGGDDTDFTTCMFCGASDGSWTEDALDLHYWKDCSLLAPCSACSQVVEVAGLPEHLLEECEHKAQFRSDPVTGTPSLSSFSLPLI